jgi:hypothetical protein
MNFAADKINWKYRRRYLIVVTAFIMALMVHAAVFIPALEVASVILTNGMWALVAFVGTYVFGAVWDHQNQRNSVTKEVKNAPVVD